MKLATLRLAGRTAAVRLEETVAIEIVGVNDVGELLRDPSWRTRAAGAFGPAHKLSDIAPTAWAPVIPGPSKIVCVGLNYRNHILEMGRELPEFPTLFAKYPEALIGPYDTIVLPTQAPDAVDWEGELAVIIGAPVRRADATAAASAIAGYSILNDVTMRDFQYRTPEWFQGKTFEATTPFGPYLLTADQFALEGELRTQVDTETVQQTALDDLVFSPAELVSYISQIFTLNPGDVIATGTPGGVGHARRPPRYLYDGAELVTTIDGLGELRNPVVREL